MEKYFERFFLITILAIGSSLIGASITRLKQISSLYVFLIGLALTLFSTIILFKQHDKKLKENKSKYKKKK